MGKLPKKYILFFYYDKNEKKYKTFSIQEEIEFCKRGDWYHLAKNIFLQFETTIPSKEQRV